LEGGNFLLFLALNLLEAETQNILCRCGKSGAGCNQFVIQCGQITLL